MTVPSGVPAICAAGFGVEVDIAGFSSDGGAAGFCSHELNAKTPTSSIANNVGLALMKLSLFCFLRACGLLRLFYVARYPALVDRGFGRTIEPKDHEVASASGSGHPVGFLACGRFLAEVDVGAAVRILGRFVS